MGYILVPLKLVSSSTPKVSDTPGSVVLQAVTAEYSGHSNYNLFFTVYCGIYILYIFSLPSVSVCRIAAIPTTPDQWQWACRARHCSRSRSLH